MSLLRLSYLIHVVSGLLLFYLQTPNMVSDKKSDNGNIYGLSSLRLTADGAYSLWQHISLSGLATVNCTVLAIFEENCLQDSSRLRMHILPLEVICLLFLSGV